MAAGTVDGFVRTARVFGLKTCSSTSWEVDGVPGEELAAVVVGVGHAGIWLSTNYGLVCLVRRTIHPSVFEDAKKMRG